MTKRNNVTLAILSIILYMTCAIGFAIAAGIMCAIGKYSFGWLLLSMALASCFLFYGTDKIFMLVRASKEKAE